jgi:hypothetical protein
MVINVILSVQYTADMCESCLNIAPRVYYRVHIQCLVGSHTECSCCAVSHTECLCWPWKGPILYRCAAALPLGDHRVLRRDWMQWRPLAWHSFCRESRDSVLGVDCARKPAAFSGRQGRCWRSLRERPRSRLALVDLLELLVLHCRQIFTYSSYEWYCWIHWAPSGCQSLTLCRLAVHDPVEIGAAMLRVDWLDGRSLEDWYSE